MIERREAAEYLLNLICRLHNIDLDQEQYDQKVNLLLEICPTAVDEIRVHLRRTREKIDLFVKENPDLFTL